MSAMHRLPLGILAATVTATLAWSHGNVTPQPVNTDALPEVGEEWLTENPYRAEKAGDEVWWTAVTIGDSGFNQNCARCHGLGAISGGIAPDLRQLDRDCFGIKNETNKQACYKETDNYFLTTIRHGKVRNGAVYMPPFEGVFNQEAMWAIKTYLETRRESN